MQRTANSDEPLPTVDFGKDNWSRCVITILQAIRAHEREANKNLQECNLALYKLVELLNPSQKVFITLAISSIHILCGEWQESQKLLMKLCVC